MRRWGDHGSDEYYAALTKLEQRYRIAIKTAPEAGIDPGEMLDDIIRWVKKRAAESPDDDQRIQALIKRIGRIREEVRELD